MRKETVIEYLYGVAVFLYCLPFYIWGVAWNLYFVATLSAIIGFVSIRHFKPVTWKEVFFVLSITLIQVHHYKEFNFHIAINIVTVIFLVLTEHEKLASLLDKFKTVLCISLLLSLVNWLLVSAIPVPYKIIEPLNALKQYNYSAYPFLVVANDPMFSLRFHGMFDEAGVIGSIIPVLLFIDNYNLKSKRNLLLFICGLLSVSFYFMVFTAVYCMFKLKIKYTVSAILLCAGLYIGFKDNAMLKETLWWRFEIEDNKLKGDNRSEELLDDNFEDFTRSDDLLLGNPFFNVEDDAYYSSSYKMYIMEEGLISFIVLVMAFAMYSFPNIENKKTYILYLFLFGSMMYQRPYIFAFMYMFILYSPIAYLQVKK
ncbi:MAG: hypothetical protein LBV26_02450 [Bacteroidales bacterium]|jgi:hypothetical protein|nr:hypothetical protein [Bacteroidales bacterium]